MIACNEANLKHNITNFKSHDLVFREVRPKFRPTDIRITVVGILQSATDLSRESGNQSTCYTSFAEF